MQTDPPASQLGGAQTATHAVMLACSTIMHTWPPLTSSYVSQRAHSARGTVSLYVYVLAAVGFNAQLRRLWPCSACGVLDSAAAYFIVCLAACSARGTVSLYLQLSASMHSYAGFGLAMNAACWSWPPLTSSYVSQRVQLEAPSACVCSCQLQCTATRALGLQCMRRAGRGRRLLHRMSRSVLTQLEAPSACTCSCRLQCTATRALGLQCMRRAGRGRRLLHRMSRSVLTQLEAPSACTCSCRLQCTATRALGLQCMRRAGRGRPLA